VSLGGLNVRLLREAELMECSMRAAARVVLLAVLALSCSSGSGLNPDAGGSGKAGLDAAGLVFDDGGSGAGDSGTGPGADSFFAQCSGASTTITGTVLAPNGTDPVSGAEVAVWSSPPPALAHGVTCEGCGGQTDALVAAPTGSNGKFTLSLDRLTKAATYTVTVRKAGFRRTVGSLAITACGATALDIAQTTLPGRAADGDLPKIAVSSGNSDHLEKVVSAMGVVDFDCVKGLSSGSAKETCTTAGR